jgi:hypothetical protein
VVPCLGSLESEYDFATGGGEGDLGYLRAKFSKLVRTHREVYVPELKRKLNITTRTITWKTARAGIEIVAVFKVIYPLGNKKRYSVRLRTGRTSGHAMLEGPETYNDPSIVIEGRRTGARSAQLSGVRTSPVATAAHRTKCAEPKIVPCLGPLESEYSFNTGGGEGDLGFLRAKYGKLARTHREIYIPFLRRKLVITRRKVTWKAARGTEIVAVFEVIRQTTKRHSRRLPTGRTSGHATLEGPETYGDPILVIEGRRTARAAKTDDGDAHAR